MRLSFASAVLAAIVVLAPAAPAQAPARLVSTVGDPIPYRIGLPEHWMITKEDDVMLVGTERLMIVVAATDMMEGEKNPLPVSPAEARRIMTNMFLGSDSLMFGLLHEGARRIREDAGFQDVVREMRSLGGQRSAYMRGRVTGEETALMEMDITIKDGIMYMLLFAAVEDDVFAAHQPLFARVRDSFALAPSPQ